MLTLKAADSLPSWLQNMTDQARQEYFKAHPESKYARQHSSNVSTQPEKHSANSFDSLDIDNKVKNFDKMCSKMSDEQVNKFAQDLADNPDKLRDFILNNKMSYADKREHFYKPLDMHTYHKVEDAVRKLAVKDCSAGDPEALSFRSGYYRSKLGF